MTNEELNQAVYDKCDREYDTFLDEVNQAFKDKANSLHKLEHGDEFLSEYAYQYTIYGDILMSLEELNLSDEKCQALLDSPSPLYSIYEEWLNTETGYMDGIRDCIESNAEKEILSQQRAKAGEYDDRFFDSLHFELGLYNQVNAAYPQSMDESRVYGIAIQAFKDGEPYGTMTVNLPNQITGECEMIGIKNAAYIDTNNFPWANLFLEKGFATDTGFTKRSGFCEYPLYQFDEGWLKSLKPLEADRSYSLYEKKYNEAMEIETEKPKEMTVVCVEPGKPAYMKTIETGLESLQHEVGGYIEATYPWEDTAAIICNEEGKITGLPLNRSLRDDEGNIYDVIAGIFLIVGLGEENFCSLTPEQIRRYMDEYKFPETIFLMDGEVKAFPSENKSLVPVYLQSAEYAYKHNELEAYRLSYQTNIDCKYDIQKTLADNYSDNRLNTESVWKQVTEKYGKERVTALLAQTCKELSGDGRISAENKKWASSIKTPDDKFIIEKPHTGLVDLLVTKARKETAKEKTSVLEKLESAKSKVAPPVPKTDRKKEQVL